MQIIWDCRKNYLFYFRFAVDFPISKIKAQQNIVNYNVTIELSISPLPMKNQFTYTQLIFVIVIL